MLQIITHSSNRQSPQPVQEKKFFCGTSDDPFYVDPGGIFELDDAPRTTGAQSIDGLKCLNVSTIVAKNNDRVKAKSLLQEGLKRESLIPADIKIASIKMLQQL